MNCCGCTDVEPLRGILQNEKWRAPFEFSAEHEALLIAAGEIPRIVFNTTRPYVEFLYYRLRPRAILIPVHDTAMIRRILQCKIFGQAHFRNECVVLAVFRNEAN